MATPGREVSDDCSYQLLDTAFQGVLIVEVSGQICYFNQRAAEMLGYSSEELGDRNFFDLLDHACRPQLQQVIQTCQLGTPGQQDCQFRCKDGSDLWAIATLTPIQQPNRKGSLLIMLVDITERKQMEETLRQQAAHFQAEQEQVVATLKQTEARFLLTFNQAAVGISEVAPDGSFLSVNPAMSAIMGYTEAEFLQMTFQQITHPDDLSADVVQNERLKRQEISSFSMKKRFLHKNHSVIWVTLTTSMVWDEFNQPLYGIGIVEDIAEQQRAENALRQSEEQFRQLAENIQDVFWLTDSAQANVLYVSPLYEQLWGRSCESLMTDIKSWVQSIHPDDRPRVQAAFSAKSLQGLYDEEYRIIRPDGSVRWIRDRAFPIANEFGEVHRIAGIAADITDRKQVEAALTESNQTLQAVIHASPLAIMGLSDEGIVRLWNPASEDIFGWTQQEVLGHFLPTIPADKHHELWSNLAIVLQGQEIKGIEARRQRKDGTVIDIALWSAPVYDAQGEISCLSVVSDITERKQAEAEREQFLAREQTARAEAEAARQRVEFLAQASSLLASSLDYETTLTSVSRLLVPQLADWCLVDILTEDGSIQRLTIVDEASPKRQLVEQLRHYRPMPLSSGIAQVLKTAQALFAPEIRKEHLAGIEDPAYLLLLQALDPKSAMCVPLLARAQVLGALSLTFSESGRRYDIGDLALVEEFARRVAIALDNARLYQSAQQARQKAEVAADRTARLQAVTAALSESLTPTQVATVIVEQGVASLGASATLVALLNEGGTELEIVRSSGHELEPAEAWRRFSIHTPAPMADAVRTGQPIWDESVEQRMAKYPHLAEIYRNTGYQTWISLPLMLEGRAVGGMTLSFKDSPQLTADDRAFILALAQQSAQAIDRARLYQAEKTARAEAESANRVKDEFLAIVSHELRTPLNAIMGWAQMLRTRKLDDVTTARALETIERNARSQNQLINDLLDVSRIIRGKVRLNRHPMTLTSVVNAAVESIRLVAESKQIRLKTQLADSVVVLGDSERLQQVVWNLLSNAVKFTPEGGQVDVCVCHVGEYAEIQVQDTGVGIIADFLPHIFEYFRQADGSTTRTHGGLGLGLAIVRHLVELHDGIVEAASLGSGQGAIFTVRLPCVSTSVPPMQGIKLSHKGLTLNGVKILILDDEQDSLDVFSFVLEKQGAIVIAVTSVHEAIDCLQTSKPDIFLSDIAMPEMDGYTLLHQVRSWPHGRGGNIPAIALTAYAAEADYQKSLAAGFQRHLAKPVDSEELIRAIASLVRAKNF